jgi:hypothetical protein
MATSYDRSYITGEREHRLLDITDCIGTSSLQVMGHRSALVAKFSQTTIQNVLKGIKEVH